MKLILLAIVLAGVLVPANAQETRTEVAMPTTAVDDARSNSDSIPAWYTMNALFTRVVIVRLKHQADLLRSLEDCVHLQKISNGVILAGIGSVRGYHYHTVVNRTFPSRNVFVRNPTGSADVVAMNGYIIGGRVHAHVTLSDPGKAFGGHLEAGTEVFTFVIITVGVLPDEMDLSRLDDKTYR